MRPEHVLFVDDNEVLRSMMARLFRKEFEHVTAVGTGREAMKQIDEHLYHIVILDKKLPDVDGFDVLAHIRKKSPHSRVVIITSDPDENLRQEALNRGAFEFFEKPFDIDKIKATLRGLRVFKWLPAKIDEKYESVTCNLSNVGILMLTNADLGSGTNIDILLHASDDRKIPLKGTIVRTADPASLPKRPPEANDSMKQAVGIRLFDPPPDYYSFLDSLVL